MKMNRSQSFHVNHPGPHHHHHQSSDHVNTISADGTYTRHNISSDNMTGATYSITSSTGVPQTSTLRLHTKLSEQRTLSQLGVGEARTAFNGDQVLRTCDIDIYNP